MNIDDVTEISICTDCLMLMANGELPPDWPEDVEYPTPGAPEGWIVSPGHLHTVDQWPFNCIDWDAAARNLEGFWTAKTANYTVYVFMDR